ncbi:MAG: ParB/RepB/Spo0J family partition protein [Bacteroidetes bacterium]|nr:ParB/RepB/Spo0J family partition protein [Bacteroidota bacterium]
MSKITHINLSNLIIPQFEAHKQIPDNYITEITESIKEHGILEPLLVRPKEDDFEIVAGCVRYRCAKIAGLKAAPCMILALNDKYAEIIKIHENIKRVPLDHIDQGNTFVMLRDNFSMTEDAISSIVGKSVAYVSQHISLVSQDEDLIRAVREERVSFSQARELMKVKDKSERRRFQNYCENEGATVEVLKQWIQNYKNTLLQKPTTTDSDNTTSYIPDRPQDFRLCQACGKATEIMHIRQLFLCPPCETALKLAISEVKPEPIQNNTVRDAQEQP